MPRPHPRFIAHLLRSLVLVSLLLPAPNTYAATNRPSLLAPTSSASSPLTLTVSTTSVNDKTVNLAIELESPVALDAVNLKLGLAPGLTLVSTTVPTQTMVTAGQRLTYEAVVTVHDLAPCFRLLFRRI